MIFAPVSDEDDPNKDNDLTKEDLNLINDILDSSLSDSDDPYFEYPRQKSNKYTTYLKVPNSPKKTGDRHVKCADIFLGGTKLKPGITTFFTEPHFCTNLHCIRCDHMVLRFPDFRWSDGVDYLFLRNNYPNKVKSKLVPSKDSCSFCCQCTYKTYKDMQKLSMYDTSWVCRGHLIDSSTLETNNGTKLHLV